MCGGQENRLLGVVARAQPGGRTFHRDPSGPASSLLEQGCIWQERACSQDGRELSKSQDSHQETSLCNNSGQVSGTEPSASPPHLGLSFVLSAPCGKKLLFLRKYLYNFLGVFDRFRFAQIRNITWNDHWRLGARLKLNKGHRRL